MRVVLEAKKSLVSSARGSGSAREFKVAGRLYAVTDNAPSELIAEARAEILKGHTAAVIEPEPFKPQAFFFDMDATVIREESLVEISKIAGKYKEVQALTEKAMTGGMDFKASLRQRLAILAGLHRDQILSLQPTITPGMKTLAEWCLGLNIPMFLVSGGFVDLAGPVAASLGFLDYKANHFTWKEDRLAGLSDENIVDAQGKCEAILHWCAIHNLDPLRCVAVGDGANDLPMMNLCGLACGFSPKATLWPHLDVANHSGDHRFLLNCMEI